MVVRNRQEIEKEKGELKVKARADLRKLKADGIEGYDGWVGVTETVQIAYERRVKGCEWVLKMLEGLEKE